ncbi:MAG: hypothetical protein H7Z75_06845 [Ferruginibacter sp.]|nr:hypothetical protein [Cytophagales bacterium]
MNDTTEDARKKQLEIIFSKTPEERFLMGIEMIDYVRTVVENSIRAENANLSAIDVRIAVFKRYYAKEFSIEEINLITESMRNYQHQNLSPTNGK